MADRKPKAKSVSPKPEKAALEKAQHQHFVESARAAGVENRLSPDFDRVAETVARAKRPPKS